MAEIQGTNVAAKIAPFTTDDSYATHVSTYGQGGWHEVADNTARDAIPNDRRIAGMAVYVTGTSKLYTLNADLTTWTEFQTASPITVDQTYNATSANPQSGVAIAGAGFALASSIPTKTSDLTNDSGYITNITSSDVTTALGYTPYNSSNPNGYTSNVGTVTSVNSTSPDANGNVTISIPSEVTETTVSGWGFTKNTGTVTSVNNTSPDANGNVTISTASAISDLTDVELTDPTDGQTLVYDSNSSKWVNGNGGVAASYNSTTKTITFA